MVFKKTLFVYMMFIKLAWGIESIETPTVSNENQLSEFAQDLIVDGIQCQGNASTDCDFIRQDVYLQIGGVLNEDEIYNAKIRLKLKNLFQSVNVFLKKSTLKYHVVIVVEVVEKNTRFLETNIAEFSSPYGKNLSLGTTWGERNLFGMGKSLIGNISFYGVGGVDTTNLVSGRINYIDPHFLNSNRYFFNAGIERFQSKSSSSNTYSLGFGRRIFDFSYLQLTASISNTHSIFNDYSTETSLDEEFKDVIFSYGWNTEDDGYFPTSGDKLNLNVSPRSDFFNPYAPRYLASYERLFPISRRNVLTATSNFLVYDANSGFLDNSRFDVGARYSYQLKDDFKDQSSFFQRARVYYGLTSSINRSQYKNNDERYILNETGLLFDSKQLGIVRLSFTHESSL